jgi:hypothetical protein
MQEGVNGIKKLTKNTGNLNRTNFREVEILNLVQALEQKIKFLENNNALNKNLDNEHCSFRDTCYTVRSKMGLCPCELYR